MIHSEDQQEALYRKQLECIGLIAAERQNASLLNGECSRVFVCACVRVGVYGETHVCMDFIHILVML